MPAVGRLWPSDDNDDVGDDNDDVGDDAKPNQSAARC